MKRLLVALTTALIAGGTILMDRVHAAEGATGFYLLGSATTNAGIVPPPGTYLIDYNYYYSGSTDFNLNIAGLDVSGGVDADAYYNIAAPLWVAPGKVLGGNLGFLMLVPIGWKNVEAGLAVEAGSAQAQASVVDDETKFGDIVPGMMLGWHQGNWHWKVQGLVNAPTGFWERGNLANIGFNRWAIDTSGAVTWIDPKIGLEVSAAAGFTYNFENPTTNHKTGTEFHLEYAAVQNFSKQFGLGINGYFYDQVTGDTGPSANLGSFKGQVAAIGPVVNLNFQVGKIPVAANLKYFHEFDVEKRLQGDAGYVTLTMPLSIGGH